MNYPTPIIILNPDSDFTATGVWKSISDGTLKLIGKNTLYDLSNCITEKKSNNTTTITISFLADNIKNIKNDKYKLYYDNSNGSKTLLGYLTLQVVS